MVACNFFDDLFWLCHSNSDGVILYTCWSSVATLLVGGLLITVWMLMPWDQYASDLVYGKVYVLYGIYRIWFKIRWVLKKTLCICTLVLSVVYFLDACFCCYERRHDIQYDMRLTCVLIVAPTPPTLATTPATTLSDQPPANIISYLSWIGVGGCLNGQSKSTYNIS